jgi:hypothetical protein
VVKLTMLKHFLKYAKFKEKNLHKYTNHLQKNPSQIHESPAKKTPSQIHESPAKKPFTNTLITCKKREMTSLYSFFIEATFSYNQKTWRSLENFCRQDRTL